jgi:hypothetical protein
MKKIKITITMTEQEAEWLEQACFIEEEVPHSKFLNRVSRLARRARHAFQQSVQSDELACDDIYHDFLLQWEEVNFCDVCGAPIRR